MQGAVCAAPPCCPPAICCPPGICAPGACRLEGLPFCAAARALAASPTPSKPAVVRNCRRLAGVVVSTAGVLGVRVLGLDRQHEGLSCHCPSCCCPCCAPAEIVDAAHREKVSNWLGFRQCRLGAAKALTRHTDDGRKCSVVGTGGQSVRDAGAAPRPVPSENGHSRQRYHPVNLYKRGGKEAAS